MQLNGNFTLEGTDPPCLSCGNHFAKHSNDAGGGGCVWHRDERGLSGTTSLWFGLETKTASHLLNRLLGSVNEAPIRGLQGKIQATCYLWIRICDEDFWVYVYQKKFTWSSKCPVFSFAKSGSPTPTPSANLGMFVPFQGMFVREGARDFTSKGTWVM